MRKLCHLFLTLVIGVNSSLLSAQNIFSGFEHLFTPAQSYVAYQAGSEIVIDGKADEQSWNRAEWSEEFTDIEGTEKPKPDYKTSVKMLWDSRYLYIFAELEEPHVWSYYEKRDLIVFEENDFEVFLDPDGDTHNYFEIEINARNTIFDLFMAKPYRNGGIPIITWDSPGLKSAVYVDGTINNSTDTDKKWTVEMAIPFSSLKRADENIVPDDGDYWKINFSRVQWKTEIVDGKYQKIIDSKTNRFLSEDNWVWSRQGIINMHFPERWGIAHFSTNPVGGDKITFIYPQEEILGKYLWLLYYKQNDFKRMTGNFASSLSDLDLDEEIETETGETLFLGMEVNETGFNAFLEKNRGLKLTINQDGLFGKTKNNSEYE